MNDIDVVIPTLNCANKLSKCIKSLKRQRYGGNLKMIVVDSGSIDDTVSVAKNNGCRVYTLPGKHSDGVNGARQFGIDKGDSEFVWLVDSDNYLVEDDVADRLMKPFFFDPSIQMTMPEPLVDKTLSTFNNYLSLYESYCVAQMKNHSERRDGWCTIPDVSYGITNCTILRRTAIAAVEGYDEDVRVLARLRKLHLSRGCISEKSHYYHETADSFLQFFRKCERRLLFFAQMDSEALNSYFAGSPSIGDVSNLSNHTVLFKSNLTKSILSQPLNFIVNFIQTGDVTWLYGLGSLLIGFGLLMRHSSQSFKVLSLLSNL